MSKASIKIAWMYGHIIGHVWVVIIAFVKAD